MARGNQEPGNVATADAPANPDVDTPQAQAGESDTPAAQTDEKAKEAKATRPKLPDGFVSPIEFRNQLAKPVEEGGRGTDIRPQIVYSYIRNGGKTDPFPFEMQNGRPALKMADALAWWDRKEARKVEREEAAKTKAAEAAAKAAAAPAETEGATSPVTEAE
jgi:hypothetical protein